MKHAALQRRVLAAERCVAERIATTQETLHTLKADTRAAVTPLRIVTGGFIGGFALGLTAPLAQAKKLANVPKLLQIATGVIGFVNAMRVQQAAEDTEEAAAEVAEASERIDEKV